MATTRRSSRTAQRAPALPRGERKPMPDLGWLLLRLTIMIALGLVLGREPLLRLANQLETSAPPAATSTGAQPLQAPRLETAAARGIRWVLRPPQVALPWAIAFFGLAGMAAELALVGLVWMPAQQRAARRRERMYLRVRVPLPTGGSGGALRPRPASDADQDFFRAIHQALAGPGRLLGSAPWAAFLLSGQPDQPAQLGVVVAARRKRQGVIATAIRKVLQGQAPGTLVEEVPDPLEQALTPGGVVLSREMRLALGSHYPLRALDDVEGSDLLGPLAAVIAPRATRYTEVQLIVRPAKGWALNRGWRARAMALKLTLERKEQYTLSTDSKALEAKLASVPYEVTIRLLAVAPDQSAIGAAAQELESITAVLGQYGARIENRRQALRGTAIRRTAIRASMDRAMRRGQLATVCARAPRFAPPAFSLLPARPWSDPDILTAGELFWHLPTPALGQLVRWLPCRQLPAPPQAFARGEPDRIVFGHMRRDDGADDPVGPTLRDLRQICHITAGMGAGKSRLLANICRQIQGGYILIDGKGDDREGSLAATMRRLLPLVDERRVVILDVLDAEWPLGLNPLAGVDLSIPGGIDMVFGQIEAIFARIDPATWGKAPGMKQFLRMAALLVLEGEEQQPSLAHVKQALIDDQYRGRLLARATNIEVITFWDITFPQLGEAQMGSRDALLRRFDALLTSEITRYLMTQTTFDFRTAMEQGLIVLVPIPHMTLGGMAGAISAMMFQAVVKAAFSRSGSDQTRTDYPLIVDEFQILVNLGATEDVETALSQLRSMGIPAIYAHQALIQLGKLADLMLINAANRVIMQTQEPDASVYARQYPASGLVAADISGQEPLEHQYAVLRCQGQPAGPLSMQPLPWPAPEVILVEEETERDWRTVLPDDSEEHEAIDLALLGLIYDPVGDFAEAVEELQEAPDEEWNTILERWEAIRKAQYEHILAHPGCIPLPPLPVGFDGLSAEDRQRVEVERAAAQALERQRWLSRLAWQRPRVLAAAAYARIRQLIEPSAEGEPLAPPERKVAKPPSAQGQTREDEDDVGEDGRPDTSLRPSDARPHPYGYDQRLKRRSTFAPRAGLVDESAELFEADDPDEQEDGYL